jgi:hypothetical protein
MKRISQFSIFLMLVALMVAFAPAAFAIEVVNPEDCPSGTNPVLIGGDLYDCVEVVEPPIETEEPPVETEEPPIETEEPCGISMLNCDPVDVPVVVATPAPVQNTDESEGISFNDSDLGVSLYVGQDENGLPMLEVYETQNQGANGNFALTVTQDDLAQFVDALPAENVLLKSAGHITIYVLTTGEIAIFVGPDSEGKVHVKVFDGIPWSHVYGFTIDPV